MDSDIAVFYKVLKDGINQKILTVINENGSLSHADLMEKTGINSDSLLNWHLKILVEFLRKNEKNQYLLTEKGQTALKILTENPEQIKNFKRKKQKQSWIALGIVYAISFSVILTLYSQEYINTKTLSPFIGMFAGMIMLLSVGYYIDEVDLMSEKAKKKRIVAIKLSLTTTGIAIGLLVALFGSAIADVITVYINDPHFIQVIKSNPAFDYIYFCSAAAIGGSIGYYIGKKHIKTRLQTHNSVTKQQ
jgi:hypothetical protein